MVVTLKFFHCCPDMPISTESSTLFLDIPSTWHALLLFSACWSSAQPQKTFSNADSSMGPFLITPTKSPLSPFPPPLLFVHTSLITPFLFSLIGIWYFSLGLTEFQSWKLHTSPHLPRCHLTTLEITPNWVISNASASISANLILRSEPLTLRDTSVLAVFIKLLINFLAYPFNSLSVVFSKYSPPQNR